VSRHLLSKETGMFATPTLVLHRGATLVSRDELARYEPPEPEGRWRSGRHSLIVDLMHQELDRRGVQVSKEEYAVQRDGTYLFAALTLNWLRDEEISAALAFRHANDKCEAMKLYAGMRVFVCDNMAISGDEIILNRKHTTGLNMAAELTRAFDRYREGALILQRNIEDMKAGLLSLSAIECELFEIFYQRILPSRLMVPVADTFFNEGDRTAWGLLQACTLHAKQLTPGPNMRAHVRLGKHFGLGKASPHVC
jgi:hypothetical protein